MDDKITKKHVVQEYHGDPAFYNDQIGHDQEPLKVLEDRAKERKDSKNTGKS